METRFLKGKSAKDKFNDALNQQIYEVHYIYILLMLFKKRVTLCKDIKNWRKYARLIFFIMTYSMA